VWTYGFGYSDLTKDIRVKCKKFKKICRDAIENGGPADNNLNAYIGDILMHCSQFTHA